MLEYDFEQSLGYWVCTTAHVMRKSLAARLVHEGITFRQWEVLALIALYGEQPQGQLMERMGIEAPTLAGILERMERDGWLDRYLCPDDRRRKWIRATEKAKAVWNRSIDCARAVRAEATQGISEEELEQFKTLCAKIRGNLNGNAEIEATAAICGDLGES